MDFFTASGKIVVPVEKPEFSGLAQANQCLAKPLKHPNVLFTGLLYTSMFHASVNIISTMCV